MDKKVTYYLGAGASAQSIPVLDQFNQRVKFFTQYLNVNLNSHEIEILYRISNGVRNEFSPDTLAKKYFHISQVTGDYSDYLFLKRFISAFIIWEQVNLDKSELDTAINYSGIIGVSKIEEWANIIKKCIDPRYDSLIATLLKVQTTNRIPKWNENVKFISWNYDSQFDLSYNQFTTKDLSSVSKYIEKYLVKLNGSATDKGSLILRDLRENYIYKSRDFTKFIFSDNKTNLKFAWENDRHQKKQVLKANEIVKATEVLIIVGYSFPYYNRSVDAAVLKDYLPTSHYSKSLDKHKIVIQEPDSERYHSIKNAILDIIRKPGLSFTKKQLEGLFIHVSDRNQFYIPM